MGKDVHAALRDIVSRAQRVSMPRRRKPIYPTLAKHRPLRRDVY
jgi:sulfite reductase alpha subunit-like flavoprotein